MLALASPDEPSEALRSISGTLVPSVFLLVLVCEFEVVGLSSPDSTELLSGSSCSLSLSFSLILVVRELRDGLCLTLSLRGEPAASLSESPWS